MSTSSAQRLRKLSAWALLCTYLAAGAVACADNPGDPAQRLAEDWLARRPAAVTVPPLTEAQALKVRDGMIDVLQARLGPAVGYKAGLTNPEVQQRFGVDHPLLGVLLRDMLLNDGARLPAAFGARPMAEADLLVRVRSEQINEALDIEEALAALDAVYASIELPDLIYAADAKPGGADLLAANVGARHGVMGATIPIAPRPDWLRRLGEVQVQLLDGKGRVLAQGESKALLGHPLQAVLWIRDAVRAEGKRLQPGQLLSLGSMTPLVPITPGTTLRARYTGLDPRGPTEISVHFE